MSSKRTLFINAVFIGVTTIFIFCVGIIKFNGFQSHLTFYIDDSVEFEFESKIYNVLPEGPVLNPIYMNLTWSIDSTEGSPCKAPGTFILAIVISAVQNTQRRNQIRTTWASFHYFNQTRLRAIFMLGKPEERALQEQIEMEASQYKDIIQNKFTDSYRNLTHKTVSALSWVSENCRAGVPWIVKVDDDVFVNPFTLKSFLNEELMHNRTPSAIMGREQDKGFPHRKGKYKVTMEEFSGKMYPSFVLGSAYILGRNAIEKLLAYSLTTPFLWLEDVFMTGLVAERAGIKRKNIDQYYSTATKKLLGGKAFFGISFSPKKMAQTWKILKRHYKM